MKVRSVTPEQALEACVVEMYGRHDVAHRDCCRTAGWAFERLFGVNPVTDATYTTNRGALRYLAHYGSVAACHDALALAAGLVPHAPAPGLIGSVPVPKEASPFGWVLGIHITGRDWAMMGPNGLCVVPCDDARAWGLAWV